MMTENEVLEALDFFEKKIIELKQQNESLRHDLAEIEAAHNKTCSELNALLSKQVEWNNLRKEYETTIERLTTSQQQPPPTKRHKRVVDDDNDKKQTVEQNTSDNDKPTTTSEELMLLEPTKQKVPYKGYNYKPISLPPSQAVRNYRFAKATEEAAQKYKTFIEKCVGNAGEVFKLPPETAAIHVDVSTKAIETYMKHLLNFKIDGKPLVLEIKGNYYANFDADEIINYLFEEVDE